jgi:NAD(P)H-hydrate epimerase
MKKHAKFLITYVNQDTAQKMDQDLFNKYNLKLELAMELAGQGVAHCVYDLIKKNTNSQNNLLLKKKPSLLILCGPGNNGGDGLVAARHLSYFNHLFYIDIILFNTYKDQHKQDLLKALTNFENVNIFYNKENEKKVIETEYDYILDCLFGFSFKGPIRNEFLQIFEYLNKTITPIISVDVPSGWEIEKGNVYNTFVPFANISLGTVKSCMKNFIGVHYFVNFFMPRKLLKEYKIEGPFYDNKEIFCNLN